MKKTLITLLALAGAAMAEGEDLTLSTAPEYNGTQGGNYAGVCFTLAPVDATRFSVTTGGELTAMVTLSSISLTERGGNDLNADRVLYITDSDNIYLGSSKVFTKADGTDVAVFNFDEGAITLNTTETYYAYLTASAADDNWEVGETTVGTGQYYSGQLAAAGGSLSSSAANWGLLNAQKGLTSTGYAPVMSISVTALPSVPEPATATLSLLALAGLAMRRRRK